ncbi:MAG TPA: J domain-containing protein, partial [Gaiellales bacterium]
MPDPYEIIGVRRDASLDEIRIAYRRSAQVLHPDRFATSSEGVRSEAAHRMRQLNTAMEAIEDERADEASGTGTLGHVTFGDRPPPPAAPATPSRPLAERRAAVRPETPPPPTSPANTPARVEQPAPAEVAPEPEPATASAESEALAIVDTPLPARTAPATPAPTPAAAVPPPVPEAPAIAATPAVRPTPPPPPPPRPAPEPEVNPYSLSAERTFGFADDDDDYDDDEPLARPNYMRPSRRGGPSRVQLAIVGTVIVLALIVIGAYFALSGGGSSEQAFAKAGAPFSFRYPNDFKARRLDGG